MESCGDSEVAAIIEAPTLVDLTLENFEHVPPSGPVTPIPENDAAINDEKGRCLALVSRDGMKLQHLKDTWRDDEDVVRVAISQEPLAVVYASERLCKDKKLTIHALKELGNCAALGLSLLDDTHKSDKEVVLAAVRRDGLALKAASEALRDDRDVVAAAIAQSGWAYAYASERLRADKSLAVEAMRGNGCALGMASECLRDDELVVMVAVKCLGSALRFASARLRAKRSVVLAAIQQDPSPHNSAIKHAAVDIGVVNMWQAEERSSRSRTAIDASGDTSPARLPPLYDIFGTPPAGSATAEVQQPPNRWEWETPGQERRRRREEFATASGRRVGRRQRDGRRVQLNGEDLIEGEITCPECKAAIFMGDDALCNMVTCRHSEHHKSIGWLYFCFWCRDIITDGMYCKKEGCPMSTQKQTRAFVAARNEEELAMNAEDNPFVIDE